MGEHMSKPSSALDAPSGGKHQDHAHSKDKEAADAKSSIRHFAIAEHYAAEEESKSRIRNGKHTASTAIHVLSSGHM